MKRFLSHISNQHIAMLALLITIVGLFIGRAVISIGIIMMVVNALFQKNGFENIKSILKHPVFLSCIAMFFLYAISGFWSTDFGYYLSKLQLHLPFLALPIAMFGFTKLDKKDLQIIFYTFIICTAIGACWSTFQYLGDKTNFDLGYRVSHVIPTPFKLDHIRFSIATVLSILFCAWCAYYETNKKKQIIISIIATWLIIYLHILSVKTGLLMFYMLAFLCILFIIIKHKKWKTGIVLILTIISLPFIAYKFSTTFYNKMYYVGESYKQMQNKEKNPNYSDEGRLISYNLAIEIWKENIFFGVGAGDVTNLINQKYLKEFPNQPNVTALLPHNQMLMILLVGGIFGAIIYLIFLFIPWFYYYKTSFLFICFWLLMLLPQMVEPLHETQYGIALHLLFYCLIIRYLDLKNKILKQV